MHSTDREMVIKAATYSAIVLVGCCCAFLLLENFLGRITTWISPLLLLLALVWPPVTWCYYMYSLTGRNRLYGYLALPLVLAIVVSGIFATGRLSWKLREYSMRRIIVQAQPLIAAINSYDKDHGKPPEKLSKLVPRYIASIPATGHNEYDKFVYESTAENERWALRVDTPLGFINFDQLRYHPSGAYPKEGWGGVLQKIDDWAYVHE